MFTLIIPVYRNEASILSLLETVESLAAQLGPAFSVIFVVDGSPDRCAEILHEQLAQRTLRARLLVHSRNFGSFAAIRTGFEDSDSEYYAVMAADLQEPPELITKMHALLTRNECDVVLGVRRQRNDPWLSRVLSRLFWAAYRKFIQRSMPSGGVDVFGCNRAFRDRLVEMDESNSTLVGLVLWLGFRRCTVEYDRRPRLHSSSAWTFANKLKYMRDSAYALSDLPLRILSIVGSIGMLTAMLMGVIVLILRVTQGFEVPGYAAVMLAVLFFGGMNLLGIGIIGAYVWRTFENTKRRPHAVVMHAASFGERIETLRPPAGNLRKHEHR